MFATLYDFDQRPTDAELAAIKSAMLDILNTSNRMITNPEIEKGLAATYPKADKKNISRAVYLSRRTFDEQEQAALGFYKPTRETLKSYAEQGKRIQLRDYQLFGGWTITELRPANPQGTSWLIKGKRTRGFYDYMLIEKYVKPL